MENVTDTQQEQSSQDQGQEEESEESLEEMIVDRSKKGSLIAMIKHFSYFVCCHWLLSDSVSLSSKLVSYVSLTPVPYYTCLSAPSFFVLSERISCDIYFSETPKSLPIFLSDRNPVKRNSFVKLVSTTYYCTINLLFSK